MVKITDSLASGTNKYIFFGGKGGVGKTVMAGATAIYLASLGKKTLLCSTNPVHSLSSCFGQQIHRTWRNKGSRAGLTFLHWR